MALARFDHQRWGSASDPLRQSDLKALAGEYGCAKQWWYKKTEQARGVVFTAKRHRGRSLLGTAVHAVIERVLTKWPVVADIPELPREHFARAFDQEWERAREDKPVDWGPKDDPRAQREAGITMCEKLWGALPRVLSRVIGLEAPFLVELDGDRVASGTIDLIGEGPDGGLVLLDWKTGQTLMGKIERAHGYQFALYARALEAGVLWPGTDRGMRLNRFPGTICVAHLRDLLPYKKRTSKKLEEPEQAAHFGVPVGTRVEISPPGKGREEPSKRRRTPTVELEAADRGPTFYSAARNSVDVARLQHSAKTLVRQVRLGIFPERITEGCSRCAFKTECFADGYGPKGDEAKEIRSMISAGVFDGYETENAA